MTKTKETLTTEAVIKDKFASDEYIDNNRPLPRIQPLRGESGADACGYFISAANMAAAGWIDFDPDRIVSYEFNSGSTEEGILIKEPRMVVVEKTPLFAIDRIASTKAERMVCADIYRKSEHSDRSKYGCARIYNILLLDASNQLLHETPLVYLAKGANLASFAQHWQQLTDEVTKCHATANSIPARPRDARFKSLCVFQFTVKRELAGNNAKSPACKVYSHVEPTQDNWEQFFLGRNDGMTNKVFDLLLPTQSLALPPGELEGGIEYA
jgi:Family of unknown function (DUF5895)